MTIEGLVLDREGLLQGKNLVPLPLGHSDGRCGPEGERALLGQHLIGRSRPLAHRLQPFSELASRTIDIDRNLAEGYDRIRGHLLEEFNPWVAAWNATLLQRGRPECRTIPGFLEPTFGHQELHLQHGERIRVRMVLLRVPECPPGAVALAPIHINGCESLPRLRA